nr:hypothetical protein [Halarchaeum acidiphilum]
MRVRTGGGRGVRLAREDVEHARFVRLDARDEVGVEFALLRGQPLRVRTHAGGREAGLLDDLADATLVDGFRDLLCGLDLVGERLDLVVAEGIGGLVCGPLAALAEVLDVLRGLPVERVPQVLKAVRRPFARLCRAEIVYVHLIRSLSPPTREPSGRRPRTPVVSARPASP